MSILPRLLVLELFDLLPELLLPLVRHVPPLPQADLAVLGVGRPRRARGPLVARNGLRVFDVRLLSLDDLDRFSTILQATLGRVLVGPVAVRGLACRVPHLRFGFGSRSGVARGRP